jgi:hypothetical protein
VKSSPDISLWSDHTTGRLDSPDELDVDNVWGIQIQYGLNAPRPIICSAPNTGEGFVIVGQKEVSVEYCNHACTILSVKNCRPQIAKIYLLSTEQKAALSA